jgi:hypothetical protein
MCDMEKPGKLKRLRRFSNDYRIVNKRANQLRSRWPLYNNNGRWLVFWGSQYDEHKEYPNKWIKSSNTCNGRNCRCNRRGSYKHPSGRPNRGHRKGWNKFKFVECTFHNLFID